MRHFRGFLLALLAFAASAAHASVPTTIRYDWFYDDGLGYFHADQGSDTWTETINGAPTFHFKFVARTSEYVQLYDASRQFYVWLYPRAFYLKGPADAAARLVKAGHWDDRRLYVYKFADGATNYFNLYPGKSWRWARNGVITVANETLRNNDQIQLHDAGTNTTFSLMDHEVWAKIGSNAWFKLADGVWN